MLIGFLDDTELVVDSEDPQPDIFVFGGLFLFSKIVCTISRNELPRSNGRMGLYGMHRSNGI